MKNRPYLVVLSTTHIIYSLTRYLSNMKHILILSGIHIPLQLLTNVEGYVFTHFSFILFSVLLSFLYLFLLKIFFYYSDISSFSLHVFHKQVTVSLQGTYNEALLKFFQPLPELSPRHVSKENNLNQSFKFGYPLNLSNYDAGIFIYMKSILPTYTNLKFLLRRRCQLSHAQFN